MKRIDIKGSIIPNDYKWYFDYLEMDSTSPNDIHKIINASNGDSIEVFINSPGGVIEAGTEIYTTLKSYKGNLKIFIVGEACSAASIIAMAGYCEMSPTALMMIHCVSATAGGNHTDMEKAALILKTADDALANAYVFKTGLSKEVVIDMMNEETWLTAEKAKEIGLIDEIMFEENRTLRMTASNFILPSEEQMNKVKKIMQDKEPAIFMQMKAKINLEKMKGSAIDV